MNPLGNYGVDHVIDSALNGSTTSIDMTTYDGVSSYLFSTSGSSTPALSLSPVLALLLLGRAAAKRAHAARTTAAQLAGIDLALPYPANSNLFGDINPFDVALILRQLVALGASSHGLTSALLDQYQIRLHHEHLAAWQMYASALALEIETQHRQLEQIDESQPMRQHFDLSAQGVFNLASEAVRHGMPMQQSLTPLRLGGRGLRRLPLALLSAVPMLSPISFSSRVPLPVRMAALSLFSPASQLIAQWRVTPVRESISPSFATSVSASPFLAASPAVAAAVSFGYAGSLGSAGVGLASASFDNLKPELDVSPSSEASTAAVSLTTSNGDFIIELGGEQEAKTAKTAELAAKAAEKARELISQRLKRRISQAILDETRLVSLESMAHTKLEESEDPAMRYRTLLPLDLEKQRVKVTTQLMHEAPSIVPLPGYTQVVTADDVRRGEAGAVSKPRLEESAVVVSQQDHSLIAPTMTTQEILEASSALARQSKGVMRRTRVLRLRDMPDSSIESPPGANREVDKAREEMKRYIAEMRAGLQLQADAERLLTGHTKRLYAALDDVTKLLMQLRTMNPSQIRSMLSEIQNVWARTLKLTNIDQRIVLGRTGGYSSQLPEDRSEQEDTAVGRKESLCREMYRQLLSLRGERKRLSSQIRALSADALTYVAAEDAAYARNRELLVLQKACEEARQAQLFQGQQHKKSLKDAQEERSKLKERIRELEQVIETESERAEKNHAELRAGRAALAALEKECGDLQAHVDALIGLGWQH